MAMEGRTGGKVVKFRRVRAEREKTPYERPPRVANAQAATAAPGLFANFILPAGRKLATGAGKLFSTVLGSDSSSSSSSDTDSDAGGYSDSENDVGCANDGDVIPSEGLVWLNENFGAPPEMIENFSNHRPVVSKAKSKHLIEELLRSETFSREEFDRLVEIIKLRVVHTPATKGDIVSSCHKVVSEARKWLDEKRSLSSNFKSGPGNATALPSVIADDIVSPVNVAKSYMHNLPPWTSPAVNTKVPLASPVLMNPCIEETPYTSRLSSLSMSKATEGDVDSPVDTAKSYMQNRPPWTSSSVNSLFPASSPALLISCMEETPIRSSASPLSKSKRKRDHLRTGPWNIQEELRKVRVKATEDMLKSVRSPNNDLSASSEHIFAEYVLSRDKSGSEIGAESHSLKLSLLTSDSSDKCLNIATAVDGCQYIPDSEVAQADLETKGTPSKHACSVDARDQDVEDIETIEGANCAGANCAAAETPGPANHHP